MNEVMQVRAASWTAMIKQRSDSGLTVNGIQESVYYYRLNRLRKMALNACETPDPTKDHDPSGTFAQISVASTVQTSNAAIRIRRGDTVMEVSRDAPDRILSFLKEVMFRAL